MHPRARFPERRARNCQPSTPASDLRLAREYLKSHTFFFLPRKPARACSRRLACEHPKLSTPNPLLESLKLARARNRRLVRKYIERGKLVETATFEEAVEACKERSAWKDVPEAERPELYVEAIKEAVARLQEDSERKGRDKSRYAISPKPYLNTKARPLT